jgi:uncharacterized repeat protein (TIGR01451 family)
VFRVDKAGGTEQISVMMSGLTIRDGFAADDNGAGLWNDEDLSLADVVLHRNRANGMWIGRGGGMSNYNSSPTLRNVSFSGNSAKHLGGGMYNNHHSSPTIQNSILWGNRATDRGDQIHNAYESTSTITYSNVEDSGGSGTGWDTGLGTDAGGNIDLDPLFVEPVDAATAPTTAGDLHLQLVSPALDAGYNGFVPPGVTTDLDGGLRSVNGTVDMGPYELQPGLHLHKTPGVDLAMPGEHIAYRIRVANTFSGTVMTGAVISDTLPDGLDLAGSISLDPPGAGVVGTPPILVSELTIQPGQFVTITLPVMIQMEAPSGIVTNTAAISSAQVTTPQVASHVLMVGVRVYLPLVVKGGAVD